MKTPTLHDKETLRLMSQLPEIGEMVTLTFQNKSPVLTGPLANTQPAEIDLAGQMMKKPQWDKNPDNFALFVANTPVMTRIINVYEVLAINGIPLQKARYKLQTKKFEVSGSKGAKYEVTFDGHEWSCTCHGFNFRKTCKHIEDKRGN